MKKIFSVMLILTLVFSLCACGKKKDSGTADTTREKQKVSESANTKSEKQTGAEQAVADMFDAFKKLDFKTVQKYINLDDIKVSDGESTSVADADTIFNTMFDRLDYKIISSEQTSADEAYVVTEITAVDIQPVVNEYFKNMLQFALENAFEEKKISDEENAAKMKELFKEAAEKEGNSTVTKTVKIKVKKDGKNWKVVPDDDFSEAVTGGIVNAIKNMPDSFDYAD